MIHYIAKIHLFYILIEENSMIYLKFIQIFTFLIVQLVHLYSLQSPLVVVLVLLSYVYIQNNSDLH